MVSKYTDMYILDEYTGQVSDINHLLWSSEYKCTTFIVFRKFFPPTNSYLELHFLLLALNGLTLLLVFPEIVPPTPLFELILYSEL